ncbi:MAG TPA: ABC transporter permease [Gemmatimonadaceae bacterium]|nr:ABC transporter permease [Gemmatimonadaceae bacterium]
MVGLVLRRVGQAALIVFLVTTLTFVLLRVAPGDPFTATVEHPLIAEETREQWRAAAGLDRPIAEQYIRYLANVARGDFGPSFSKGRPVSEELASAVPNTLLLMLAALVASFVLGVALGVFQAVRRGSIADRAIGGVALFFYSMPDFWLALMVLLLFAYRLGLFPVGGMLNPWSYEYYDIWGRIANRLHHLALPAGTLTLLSAAAIARYQRSAVLDVARQDYVRTARAKGVSERRVVTRHILRNALLPVITLLGLAFPALLGGAVFVEKVFAWPGMGRLAVEAIGTRDYHLVTATVIIAGVMVSIGSLLADLLYAAVDPRLRET